MWNDDEDVDERGETVQLFLPTSGPPRRTSTDVADPHIGGQAHGQDAPACTKCQDPMFLLAQIQDSGKQASDGSKVDRTVCVFGCPKSACFESMSFENGFSSGGSGIMACRTVETPIVAVVSQLSMPAAPVKSSWYSDDGNDDDDDDNDWGAPAADMSKLEAAVAAMENKLEDGAIVKESKVPAATPLTTKPSVAAQSESSPSSSPAFACYLLTKQSEPFSPNKHIEEDDVGLSASDDKVRNMLARYMAEEDDEDILAALKGTDMGGGAGGEEDERLSEDERLLLGFQDRLRRVPRQVVRYARGGVPLWSIPSMKNNETLWKLPACSGCGNECIFEMQLMPSLLHVLKVDKFASSTAGKGDQKNEGGVGIGIGDLLTDGMNWGSVAVFTCPDTECTDTDGALVIQESVDERPKIPVGQQGQNFAPTVAVVEDMDDDAEFEPYQS